MKDNEWAIQAILDIIQALPEDRYIYARFQLGDAVESILQADAGRVSAKHRHKPRARFH